MSHPITDAHVASRAIVTRYTMARLSGGAQGSGQHGGYTRSRSEGRSVVVHARMGQRDQYRPIETPLSPTSKPVDVSPWPSVDLSVHRHSTSRISMRSTRRATTTQALTQLKDRISRSHILGRQWRGRLGAAHKAGSTPDLGHLVLGSETQKDGRLSAAFPETIEIILSLDYRGDAFVGPRRC